MLNREKQIGSAEESNNQQDGLMWVSCSNLSFFAMQYIATMLTGKLIVLETHQKLQDFQGILERNFKVFKYLVTSIYWPKFAICCNPLGKNFLLY